MTRNTLNLVVDIVTFLALIAVTLTGLLMKFVLPAGSPREGLALFGWDRHVWADVHFWATVALGAVLILHLALHWRWVCAMVGRLTPGPRRTRMPAWERNLLGVAWLAIIVGVTAGLIGGAKVLVQRDQGLIDEHRGVSSAPAPRGDGLAQSAGEGARRRAGWSGR